MLGADLGQMDELAQKMRTTNTAIGKCQTSTNAETQKVVASVTAEAKACLQRIQGELTELRTSVKSSAATAASTNWVGANAVKFKGSSQEFDLAMQKAETATAEAFTQFQASIQQMSDALATYQNSFSAALTNAQASTGSMENAVIGQRNHLDQVMNQGMNIS